MTRQPTGVFTPSTDKRGQGRKNYRIAGEKLRRSLEKKTRKNTEENTDTPRRQDLTRGSLPGKLIGVRNRSRRDFWETVEGLPGRTTK